MLKFFKKYIMAFLCVMTFIAISVLFVSAYTPLGSTKQELPSNPLSKKAMGNQLVLLNNTKDDSISPITVDKGIDGTITQKEESDGDSISSDSTSQQSDDEDDNKDSDNTCSQSPQDVSQIPKQKNSGGSSYDPDLEVPDDSDNSNPSKYFSTNIKNNTTVTVPDFSFSITHKNPQLDMVDHVILNSAEVADFNGTVTLKRGKNSIKISVDIKQSDGKTLTVSQLYSVYFYDDKLVVYTDLKDNQNTDKDSIRFYSYARYGKDNINVKVTVNSNEVHEDDIENHSYSVTLNEGDNKIAVSALTNNGKSFSKIYHVNYIAVHTDLKFETNLKDQQTSISTLNFTAKAMDSDESNPLTVKLNGKVIDTSGENKYSAHLKEGSNKIELSTSKYKDTLIRTFTVTYVKPVSGTGEKPTPENKNKPKINILYKSLVNNETVVGSTKNFSIYAVDYKGNYISSGNFDVKCNGKSVHLIWSNDDQVSYRAFLNAGKNTITIGVKDKEGNFNNLTVNVNCNIIPDGQVIGTATFSLEASVLGMPYIIKPTVVEIHQGENSAKILDRLLKQNNFSYEMTGNLDKAFYLARVNFNKDLITKPTIPQDLYKHLTEGNGWEVYSDSADPSSLGEFDFTQGSGWMYSINGLYPNYGFADAYLKPGDTVRIRFTLAYGADIGGAAALGSGDGNWEKEW